MSRPAIARILLSTLLLSGCATDNAPSDGPPSISPSESTSQLTFEAVDVGRAREMPPPGPFQKGRLGAGGRTIFTPASVPIEHGIAYRFSLGHCGLLSPIDVDASFWDVVDGVSAAGAPLALDMETEMINATPGVIVVIGDELRFRTESGSIIRFERHAGEKAFPGCA